jgi:hypothetical protein
VNVSRGLLTKAGVSSVSENKCHEEWLVKNKKKKDTGRINMFTSHNQNPGQQGNITSMSKMKF